MKSIPYLSLAFLLINLTSCRSATPPPFVAARAGAPFSLAPDQIATLEGAGLSIRLLGVPGDERCPLKIECAASGPVTVTLSVQKGSASPVEFTLQTFTDNDGRAPNGRFEGIQSQVEYEGFVIRVMSVLPFPQEKIGEIREADYRVAFLVAAKLIDI